MSRAWIAGSPEAFGNMREALEKLCSETNKCNYEIEQGIREFSGRLSKAQLKLVKQLPN